MLNIEELKKEINLLKKEDFKLLRQWIAEKDWIKWDEKIEADDKTGKLDFLIEEAVKSTGHKKLKVF